MTGRPALSIERDLSNSVFNTSISGVKLSWTGLYRLSAITAGIRQKWVDAISASAHLETDSEDDDDDDEDEDNDEDDDNGDTVDDGNPEEADDHDDDDMQGRIV